jgi:hypothetical protein
MKALFTFTLAFCYHLILIGQISQGEFISENDHFSFYEDTVQFEFETNSAFIIITRGVGAYEIVEDYLIVRTFDYPGIKSRIINSTSSSSDLISIQVNSPNQVMSVLGQDGQGKTLKTYQLDGNNNLKISPNDKVELIKFSTLGFDPLTFKPRKGFDYVVEIVEGVTVENQNLVFIINDLNQDSINLTLIDSKAKNSEIISLKALNKLRREKGKFTFWTQELKKK